MLDGADRRLSGGSIPCWSASKLQDRRPAEKQRARGKKKRALDVSHVFRLELVSMWFLKMPLLISFSSGEATY